MWNGKAYDDCKLCQGRGRYYEDNSPRCEECLERRIAELEAELGAAKSKWIVYNPDAKAMSDRVKQAEHQRDTLAAALRGLIDWLQDEFKYELEERLVIAAFSGEDVDPLHKAARALEALDAPEGEKP